jgi:hypothetical protein
LPLHPIAHRDGWEKPGAASTLVFEVFVFLFDFSVNLVYAQIPNAPKRSKAPKPIIKANAGMSYIVYLKREKYFL